MKAELLTCCFCFRFTLNEVLSALEEDQVDDSQFEDYKIEVAVLPPDKGRGGITDEDLICLMMRRQVHLSISLVAI